MHREIALYYCCCYTLLYEGERVRARERERERDSAELGLRYATLRYAITFYLCSSPLLPLQPFLLHFPSYPLVFSRSCFHIISTTASRTSCTVTETNYPQQSLSCCFAAHATSISELLTECRRIPKVFRCYRYVRYVRERRHWTVTTLSLSSSYMFQCSFKVYAQ